jgi:hypothetical protein
VGITRIKCFEHFAILVHKQKWERLKLVKGKDFRFVANNIFRNFHQDSSFRFVAHWAYINNLNLIIEFAAILTGKKLEELYEEILAEEVEAEHSPPKILLILQNCKNLGLEINLNKVYENKYQSNSKQNLLLWSAYQMHEYCLKGDESIEDWYDLENIIKILCEHPNLLLSVSEELIDESENESFERPAIKGANAQTYLIRLEKGLEKNRIG